MTAYKLCQDKIHLNDKINHLIYNHLLQGRNKCETSVYVTKCDRIQYTHPCRAANCIQQKCNNDVLDKVTYHLQKVETLACYCKWAANDVGPLTA